MRYVTAVILFAVFVLAATFAPYLAIVGLALGQVRYAGNIAHSLDMLLAAMLGWNGRATVSEECGKQIIAGNPCRFCRLVCSLLDKFLETDHCRKEGGADGR